MRRTTDRILSVMLMTIVSVVFLVLLFYSINMSGVSIYYLNLDALSSMTYYYSITILGISLIFLAFLFMHRRFNVGSLLMVSGVLQITSVLRSNPFSYAFYFSLPLIYMIIGARLKGSYKKTVYFFAGLMLLVVVFGVVLRESLALGWVGFFQLLFIAFEVLLFSLTVFQLLFIRRGALVR